MRRFCITSLITLALVVGATPATTPTGLVWWPAAHAQSTCPAGQTQDAFGTCTADANAASAQQTAQSTAANTQAGLTATGGLTTQQYQDVAAARAVTESKTTADEAYNGVMTKIMSLFAWLVGVAAVTLDYAVYYTVVTMGSYVNNLSAVGVTWSILRDIGNILLIFGFLAVGITTIINKGDWYGGGTKMLPMLFVAAVFLNFSLFISEAVIDTGNLFATQFYTQIKGGALPTAESLAGTSILDAVERDGISNKIMGQLGLQTLYGDVRTNPDILKGGNPWTVGFMGVILFLITAFVMFSLAFILIARFVILLFLIIIAPVGFAGLAVPKLSSLAGKWWNKLFEQTITAPVLLLLLYIALAVITDERFLTGMGGTGRHWTGFVENNDLAGFASMILSFLVATGLLLAVVILSKSLSAFGGDWATKMGGRLSFGAVSLGGRATLGMTGNLLASKRMQSAARRGGVGGLLLKGAVLGGKGLRGATYDFRNAPGAAAGLGAISIDAGKGATFTARQAHEAQYGWKPTKEWLERSKEEREQAGREMDFKNAQADLAAGRITQAAHDAIVLPILSKMTTKQLEELGGIRKGVDALVNNLSPQQFEALMKSDKLNDTEKGKIKDARYRTLSNAIGTGNLPNIKKAVNSFSKGELESMPTTMLTNPLVLDQLSDKQRETINDSKERTAAEKDLVRKSSPIGSVETIFNAAGGGVAGAAAVAGSPNFARLTVPQIAKLDKAILTQPTVAEKLTTATLIELQEQKKLTPTEMIDIGNHIRVSATANAKTKEYVTTGPGAALWT